LILNLIGIALSNHFFSNVTVLFSIFTGFCISLLSL
jgi:hypothetical protein